MKIFSLLFIGFGILVIIFPELLAYMIGGFFIFIGINMLVISLKFQKTQTGKESYVKFGNYKIYR